MRLEDMKKDIPENSGVHPHDDSKRSEKTASGHEGG